MSLTLEDLGRQLRPASYRGVPFQVDSTQENFGRRVAVHEFPNVNGSFNEDLGEKPRRFTIEGYVVGSDWRSNRDRLITAASFQGPGTLVHPFYRTSIRCRALSLNVKESKDKLGCAKFTLELVREISIPALSILNFLLGQVRAAVGGLLDAAFAAFQLVADFRTFLDSARTFAIETVQTFALALDEARILFIPGGTVGAGALEQSVQRLNDNASNIVDNGTIEPELRAVVNDFRAAAPTPEAGAAALERVLYINSNQAYNRDLTGSLFQSQENRRATGALFRRVLGALWTEFVISSTYGDRAQAGLARTNLIRWLDSESQLVVPQIEGGVLEAIDELRSQAVKSITQTFTESTPVREVTINKPTSAIALATRLYADPARAEEIFNRNPGFSISRVGPNLDVLVR